MECIGGSGVMEDCMLPRLFRESPINAIWEGSGNVQCLDVLRAMQKTPEVVEAFVAELSQAKGEHPVFDAHLAGLLKILAEPKSMELQARNLVDRMATGLQAALLIQYAPSLVSDIFCRSRLQAIGVHNYGTLPADADIKGMVTRAWPMS
jgi:putative acyl-CoA dehydrogenase